MKTASQVAEALKDFKGLPKGKFVAKGPVQESKSRPVASGRPPYAFNLGLDFGTAFTKCMLRDIRQDRAIPVTFDLGRQRTFFLPSEVYLDDGELHTPLDGRKSGAGLGCLKMALYAATGDRRGDPWLIALARHWPSDDETKRIVKVEAIVIYFLASVIRHARNAIHGQRSDFGTHKDDTLSVNMAVPIAHVQESGVKDTFEYCLNRAWRVAHDRDAGAIAFDDCLAMVRDLRGGADEHLCAVYPEVSANVQAYIRSRAGFEGLYMFIDVGAGTVDASTFIYWPKAADTTLTYLAAEVVPLGASQIELRAAAGVAGRLVDTFRCCKEGTNHEKTIAIEADAEVKRVSVVLGEELGAVLTRCAAVAREKLTVERRRHTPTKQWHGLQVLLGGGGSIVPIYRKAAIGAFKIWSMEPETSALPEPIDVDWPPSVTNRAEVFRRMTVAYGLSFDFPTLDRHRLPSEIEPLPPDDEPPSERPSAPSKDEV